MSTDPKKTASDFKICVVGASAIGIVVAVRLQVLGFKVTLISEEFPSQSRNCKINSINSPMIMYLFDKCSEFTKELFKDSLIYWREYFEHEGSEILSETELYLDDDSAIKTLVGIPCKVSLSLLQIFMDHGGITKVKRLDDDERKLIASSHTLHGFDHTVVTTGLDMHGLKSQFEINTGVEVFLTFPPIEDMPSYYDRTLDIIIASHPDRLYCGGQLLRNVPYLSLEDTQTFAEQLLFKIRNNLHCELKSPKNLTISQCLSAFTNDQPIHKLGFKCSFFGAYGRNSWQCAPGIAENLASHLMTAFKI